MQITCQACNFTFVPTETLQVGGVTRYKCSSCSALYERADSISGFPTGDGSGFVKLVAFGTVQPPNAHIFVSAENLSQLDNCPFCGNTFQIKGYKISDDIFKLVVQKPQLEVKRVLREERYIHQENK